MKSLKVNFTIILGTLVFTINLTAKEEQPNFLIILGDDISSSDIGCYGSLDPYTTPNIDQLAKEVNK